MIIHSGLQVLKKNELEGWLGGKKKRGRKKRDKREQREGERKEEKEGGMEKVRIKRERKKEKKHIFIPLTPKTLLNMVIHNDSGNWH